MNPRLSSILASLFVLVLACAPGSPRSPEVAATPPEAGAPGPQRAPKGPGAALPVPRVFDESILRGKEFLFEAGFAAHPILDVVVGPLDTGPEARVVERFLDAVVRGEVDDGDLDPEWAEYVGTWARSARDEGVTGKVRVGAPRVQGATYVPVRVWNPAREWVGWVVLVRSEDRWLVTDAQLSRPRDQSPFDPEAAQPISSPSLR